jgi:hypothetical protein
MSGVDGDTGYLVHTNLTGAYNCLELARRDEAFVVFLSTSRVYPVAPQVELGLEEAETRFEIAAEQEVPGISPAGLSEEFPLEGAVKGLLANVYFRAAGAGWRVLDYNESRAFEEKAARAKRRGLQGPIDDAFTGSFLCVRGTEAPWSPALASSSLSASIQSARWARSPNRLTICVVTRGAR